MEVPSVGNPLLHAATLASQRQKAREEADTASPQKSPADAPKPPNAPESPSGPQPAPDQAPGVPAPSDSWSPTGPQPPDSAPPDAASPDGRTREQLERLADEVLAVFEDSPDRLNDLVATLKRLERSTS